MRESLAYFFKLVIANMKTHKGEKKKFFILSFFMWLQNFIFFFLWVIFFRSVSHLEGWDLRDVARMFALISFAFGLCNFLFAGIRYLPQMVADGSFDSYLTKPRHPLLPLLCTWSGPAAFGDILFGPLVLWLWGDITGWGYLWFLCLALLSAILLLASTILAYATALWLKGNVRFPDQLYEMLLIFSINIIHGQSLFVKILAFTVVPAAFINYLPTSLLRGFQWDMFALLIAGAIFYSIASVKFFNAGVRRYVRMQ